jgi:hypothetical protein
VRNATVKQSRSPGGNKAAKTSSRINPKTRLHMIARATTPVAFTPADFSSGWADSKGDGAPEAIESEVWDIQGNESSYPTPPGARRQQGAPAWHA